MRHLGLPLRPEEPVSSACGLGSWASGAGGQITQVPGPEFYPLEWTPYGSRSNLEGGLVPGGRSDQEEMGLQVMPSVLYKQSQVTIKYLRKLLDGKIFDNPKDHDILARLVEYVTKSGDLVLDFFAGSGPTGQAVMEVNAKSGGRAPSFSCRFQRSSTRVLPYTKRAIAEYRTLPLSVTNGLSRSCTKR